jgi:hypothetical protein
MKRIYRYAPMLLLAAPWANAWDAPQGVTLGQPSYGGNGCPAGTASATLSPDSTSLSLLFDQYQVEAGGITGRNVDRKSCNVAIPVNVPQGYSVSILKIDYRGFNALPIGANSTFNVEYFFAGQQGPAFQKNFSGPLNDNFTLSNTLIAEAVVWSACGAQVTLRTNTSLMAQTNWAGEQAMATVDSADVNASVIYRLQWKRCGDPGPGPGPGPGPIPGGACTISSDYDYYGRVNYTVRDINYRAIQSTSDYNQALLIKDRAERDGTCLGQYQPPTSCRIDLVRDGWGDYVYRVSNRYGQRLSDHATQSQANQATAVYQRNGDCDRYVSNPIPPFPGPGPIPPYPTPGRQCSVIQGRDAYGRILWRVTHTSGAVLATMTDYNEAVRYMNQHPRCR